MRTGRKVKLPIAVYVNFVGGVVVIITPNDTIFFLAHLKVFACEEFSSDAEKQIKART